MRTKILPSQIKEEFSLELVGPVAINKKNAAAEQEKQMAYYIETNKSSNKLRCDRKMYLWHGYTKTPWYNPVMLDNILLKRYSNEKMNLF